MGAHHKGRRYTLASKAIRDAANANPQTLCWYCRDTMTAHHQRWPTARLRWTAGHTRDGSTTWTPWMQVSTLPPPGDWLAPQCSKTNYGTGATLGNTQREPHSENWWA